MQNASYYQDQNNYYVNLVSKLGDARSVVIQFSGAPLFDLRIVILAVVIVAIIAAGIILVVKRGQRSNRKYYLDY